MACVLRGFPNTLEQYSGGSRRRASPAPMRLNLSSYRLRKSLKHDENETAYSLKGMEAIHG